MPRNPIPLSKIADIMGGFAFKSEDFGPTGFPVVKIAEIEPPRVNLAACQRIPPDKVTGLERFRLQDRDIVIAMTGATIGKAGRIRSSEIAYLNQRVAKISAKAGVEYDNFIYALVSQRGFDEEVLNHSNGSAQANVSAVGIGSILVPDFSLKEQRAIAGALGALDDKIELNRKMNETLEAMARALFKSWFVDFDPVRLRQARSAKRYGGSQSRGYGGQVRAKAEGRDTDLPKSIADLFPDSFEDSDLGQIPEGWSVVTLEELASIQGGKQLPTEECRPSGRYPVFGANGIMGYAEKPTHDGFVIAFGRVGAYCGSIHWTYRAAWINNNASSVVPKRWAEYVLQAMLHADFAGMRTGSAQPFIPNSALAGLRVVRPSDAVLDAFCSAVKVLRLKQSASTQESRTLAAIRDTLLPKLLSGEISVDRLSVRLGISDDMGE